MASKVTVWLPLKEGTVSLNSGGDNMGLPRPKELVLQGESRAMLVLSSLSMKGEDRIGYTVRFPDHIRVCAEAEVDAEGDAAPLDMPPHEIREAIGIVWGYAYTGDGTSTELRAAASLLMDWLHELTLDSVSAQPAAQPKGDSDGR